MRSLLLLAALGACSRDEPPARAPPSLSEAGGFHRALTEDMNRFRIVASMAIIRPEVPVKDGRLDVYALVGGLVLPSGGHDTLESLFSSSRWGTGPTEAEIESGSYENFPWERCRAEDVREGAVYPLLWEKRPDRDGKLLVSFSDGASRRLTPAELDAARGR